MILGESIGQNSHGNLCSYSVVCVCVVFRSCVHVLSLYFASIQATDNVDVNGRLEIPIFFFSLDTEFPVFVDKYYPSVSREGMIIITQSNHQVNTYIGTMSFY